MASNTFGERTKKMLEFLGMSQRKFATEIGVTDVYISKLINESGRTVSKNLALSIENKFGISADWLLNGVDPMIKTYSKNPQLSAAQRKLAGELEKLSLSQINAVIAFMDTLEKLEEENKSAKQVDKVDEYVKFLEWQNEQKNKK